VGQVLVAGDGDEHVEVLGEGEELVLDGRHLRLEHFLHLLLHLVEGDGSGHSEHAGLAADVLERAVGRPGDDAAAEAAEELDAAAPAAAEDTGRREMHVLVRRRALGLRRRRPLRRHRVLYLSHDPAAVNQSFLTRKQAIEELPPRGLRKNDSTFRHQFCPIPNRPGLETNSESNRSALHSHTRDAM
jgi:hypothetical protein